MEDRDIIAMAKDDKDAVVQVFFVREGRLIGREHYHVTIATAEDDRQILTSFVQAVLRRHAVRPKGSSGFRQSLRTKRDHREWLSAKRGQKVKLVVPQKGRRSAW